jgi:hypothetical protein
MANPSPIAGFNPPGSTGTSPNVFQNTLTPGYTGGFGTTAAVPPIDWSKVDPNTIAPYAIFTNFSQNQRQQEMEAEERLFDKIQGMRKREAQEAEAMQRPYKVAQLVGGQINNIFQNAINAVTPIRAYEMSIRGRTPELLAQVYSNNPYAGRKWLT